MRYSYLILIALACFLCLAADDTKVPGRGSGLVAHYYRDISWWAGNWQCVYTGGAKDQTFTHYVHSRVEPLINHRFIHFGWFSVCWKGILDTSPAGERDKTAVYKFEYYADDGGYVMIDGKMVVNAWIGKAETDPMARRVGEVELTPGKHEIVIGYYQGVLAGHGDQDPAILKWSCPDRNIQHQIVPASHFSHTEDHFKVDPGRLDVSSTQEDDQYGKL